MMTKSRVEALVLWSIWKILLIVGVMIQASGCGS